MNDPRVEWLRYRLELGPSLSITDPPAREHETEHFTLKLDAGKLTVMMKEQHASVESAQGRVRPLLRGWEIDDALQHGPGAFRFVYEDARIIERNPPSPGAPGSCYLHAGSGSLVLTGSAATLTHGLRAYPAPPLNFVASPDVETLWFRYEMYREGKEPLASMAYFCFTAIRALGGAVDGAASTFHVSAPVLRKLSELTSKRGDAKTGRKYVQRSKPLHPHEAAWIDEVVRALIRQVAGHAGGATLKTLTMADFPALPK